MAPEK